MARLSPEIVFALRETALAIEKSQGYQWGHMGSCNCGFLARQVTSLSRDEIHACALEKEGDWSQHVNDYCPASGLKFDDIISQLLCFGFDVSDLKHLERLSDPTVISHFTSRGIYLRHNAKSDVVRYLRRWADNIEERLLERITLEELQQDQQREAETEHNLLAHGPGSQNETTLTTLPPEQVPIFPGP